MDRRFFVFALAAVTLPVTGCEKKTALPDSLANFDSAGRLVSCQSLATLPQTPSHFSANIVEGDRIHRPPCQRGWRGISCVSCEGWGIFRGLFASLFPPLLLTRLS